MSLNIYGSSLDGIKTYKDYVNGRVRSVSEAVENSLRATPEQQTEFLQEITQLQHDLKYAESLAKIMVSLIKDINP